MDCKIQADHSPPMESAMRTIGPTCHDGAMVLLGTTRKGRSLRLTHARSNVDGIGQNAMQTGAHAAGDARATSEPAVRGQRFRRVRIGRKQRGPRGRSRPAPSAVGSPPPSAPARLVRMSGAEQRLNTDNTVSRARSCRFARPRSRSGRSWRGPGTRARQGNAGPTSSSRPYDRPYGGGFRSALPSAAPTSSGGS